MSHGNSSLKAQWTEWCVKGTFYFSSLFTYFSDWYVRPKCLTENVKERDKIEAFRFGARKIFIPYIFYLNVIFNTWNFKKTIFEWEK